MRIMGLDVGSQTIGVSVSDPFGWTAQGVETIRHTTREKDFQRLKELVDMYQVELSLDNLTTEGISLTGGFNGKMVSKIPIGRLCSSIQSRWELFLRICGRGDARGSVCGEERYPVQHASCKISLSRGLEKDCLDRLY